MLTRRFHGHFAPRYRPLPRSILGERYDSSPRTLQMHGRRWEPALGEWVNEPPPIFGRDYLCRQRLLGVTRLLTLAEMVDPSLDG